MLRQITIRESQYWDRIRDFFIGYRLEYEEGEPRPEETIKLWEAIDREGILAGAASLAYQDGRYALNGIATDGEFRGIGLGGKLLETVLEEVKARGGEEIYLIGRIPEFYKHYDFEVIPVDEVPDIFECTKCDQYQNTCFPEAMKKKLK